MEPRQAGRGKEPSASLSLLSALPSSLLVTRHSTKKTSAPLHRCAISIIPDEIACHPVGKPTPPPQDTFLGISYISAQNIPNYLPEVALPPLASSHTVSFSPQCPTHATLPCASPDTILMTNLEPLLTDWLPCASVK